MASSRLRYWLFCVALLVGLCCVAPAAMAAPAANLRVAKVTALSGEVQVKKAGGEKNFKAFKNMGLTEGDTIITGKESSVTLALDEFKDVRIGENSQVLINELRVALEEDSDQTTFSLLAGGLWSSIRKQLNLDSRYQIKTANAVMGVRGTMFYVGQTSDGATTIAVLDGTVSATSTDVNQGEQVPTSLITAGQQLRLDEPPEQIADFIVEELSPSGLDSFALQIIEELSVNRPDLVSPELAGQVREIIERRQQEQPANPPPPPSVEIIYDPAVIPAQPDDEEDSPAPQLPMISLQPISSQTVAVGDTIFVSPIVWPLGASISATASDSAGLEILTENSGSTPLLQITGKQLGAYGVTVRASLNGHASATTDFTVTVTAANAAPVVSEAEVDGDCYVGEKVWVVYEYSDEEDNVEQGTTYQWFAAAPLADVPEGSWAWEAIAGANAREYLPTDNYQGLWLRCEVTPSDYHGAGDPVMSLARGPIGEERLAVEFPAIEEVTVFEDGHVMIPLPVSPDYLQDPYSYAPGDFIGFTSDDDIASISVYSSGGRYLLGVDGRAIGETVASIVVSSPEYKTLRLNFPVTVIEQVSGELYPAAQNPVIQGSLEVGSELTAGYLFVDSAGHVEGNSYFDWRISSSPDDSYGEHIPGVIERTYTLTEDDEGKYIILHIYPCDQYGKWGENMWHAGPLGPILPRNTAPQVSNVRLTGGPNVGAALTLTYTFADDDGDIEDESHIQWYRGSQFDAPDQELIVEATSCTYTLTEADEGQYVWAKVVPRDEWGKLGQAVSSAPCGRVVPEDYIWSDLGDLSEFASALKLDPRLTVRRAEGEQLYVAYLGSGEIAHVVHWDGVSWSELLSASPAYSGLLQLDVENGIPYIAYTSTASGHRGVWVKRYQGQEWEVVGGGSLPIPADTTISSISSYGLSMDVRNGVVNVVVSIPTGGAWVGWPRKPVVYQDSGDGWTQLGPIGLLDAERTAGVAIATDAEGVPYVAYRDLDNADPIHLMRYADGWHRIATYDSNTEEQVETFELACGGDGMLYLMTSFFADHYGPAVLVHNGVGFTSIGDTGFGEEIASFPTGVVTDSQTFAAYQNDQGVVVYRLNGGGWTHFGGTGIAQAITPSLTASDNTLYLAYADQQSNVHVVSATVPAADASPLPTMNVPTWSESSPARAEWTALDGASAYRLQVFKGSSPIKIITLSKTATSYDLGELLRANGDGSYTVQIRAIGDGQVYADGAYSSPSQALVGPIALAGVETPVWSDDSTLAWEQVSNAAGYRLALNRGETLDQSETIYEVDVDSEMESYDFSQVIDIADKRIWDNTLQAVNYYAMVTSLGSGIYANGPTSPVSAGLERIAVPPVSEITLSDERDAGNASDFDVSLTLPSDQANVAEYRIILHASSYYQLKLGDLTDVPSSRYQSISTSTASSVQLRADLLDWEGRPVTVGKSYWAYVITVPNDGASCYAYSKSAESALLTVADFRITSASAEAGSTHVCAELHLSKAVKENLSLSGDDFSVRPVIGGVPGEELTGVTVYPSYNTISLTIPAVQSVSEYEITVTSPSKVLTTDDRPLVGNYCWTSRIWSSTALDIESVTVDHACNQVVLQFAATPNDDRFFLAVPGEVSVRLLQSVNLQSDLRLNLALSAYYTSDGKLVINLPHAETGNYGEAVLDFLSELYPQVSLEGDLVLRDNGDAWGYSWRPFQPGV